MVPVGMNEIEAVFHELDERTKLAVYVKVLERRLKLAEAREVDYIEQIEKLQHSLEVHESAVKNGAQ
jgi:hypothetical protein